MPESDQSSRRGFFELAAGAGALLSGAAAGQLQATPSVNPFQDPAYASGKQLRLREFMARGADPNATVAIFNRLTSLDAEPWVAEWTKLAVPFEHQGAELESQGKLQEANQAYLQASIYYGIARFPVINHPAKQAAYRKDVENYLKAARSLDPPLERVTIPFEGKQIIGYLRKPKGVARPPIVIATGGVDVYKEERNTADLLEVGLAAFSMDMPGAGECPLWNTHDAERLYTATIDYLLARPDLDGRRMGFVGRSYGGYWGAKMAYVESKRLRASVQWGGPVHYTFQEPWLKELQNEKEYFWPLLDSMIYANHAKNYDELIKTAPAMSLQAQGWLDKPCAPMLAVNGEKDPWISPQEIPLLLETGQPKAARLMADGAHMGRGSRDNARVGRLVMEWLRDRLAA